MEKRGQLEQREIPELVVIHILLQTVEVALDVQVVTLRVDAGVAADVIEDKFVIGGATVGGKQVDGHIIERVLELILFLEALADKVETVDLEEVMII